MPTKKVTIKKAPVKGKLTAYTGDEYGSNGRPAGWNKSKYAGQDDKVEALARKIGYVITPESTNEDFQKYILTNPEVARKFPKIKKAVLEMHRTFGEPIAGKYDNYFGKRWDGVFDAIDGYEDPKFADKEVVEKINQLGKEYGITLDDLKKGKYVQKNLPFNQITPELANYANAQNTYGYYTPDMTHWELNPQQLNIQPQLQDIDSSMNALYATTTGNPALDAAQKQAAYVEGLKAKQNAFGNKQNYDAASRFEADRYNMAARTGEQNIDAEYTSKVHNDYRALAKDAAAYERINALQSIVKKQAENKKNEAEKSLMLDNFYNNVEVDENGNFRVKGSGIDFDTDPYYLDEDEDTETSTPPYLPIDPSKPYIKPGDPGFVGPVKPPKPGTTPRNPNYVQPFQPELFMTKPITPQPNEFYRPKVDQIVDRTMYSDDNDAYNWGDFKTQGLRLIKGNPQAPVGKNLRLHEEGGFAYDPSYMMPIRPIKKAKSLDKYFLPK